MNDFANEFGFTVEQLEGISNKGFDLLEFGEFDAAEKVFRGLVALSPEDPEFLAALGLSLRQLGRIDDAERVFDEALTLWSGSPLALFHRGDLRCRRGDPTGLSDLLKAAEGRSPMSRHARAALRHFERMPS